MRHFDFTQQQIEQMLEEGRDVRFSKTSSRSVLGSMNDMKQILDHTVYQLLNHTPFKAIGYRFPEEEMREMLNEMVQP